MAPLAELHSHANTYTSVIGRVLGFKCTKMNVVSICCEGLWLSEYLAD